MHLLTQSALLRALGWSLIDSLWQMALLWLFYHVLIIIFRTVSANARHGLAVLFTGLGVTGSALSFIVNYGNPDFMSGSGFWPSPPFLQAGERLINEALPYCSFGYLLVLIFLFIRYCSQYIRSRQLKEQGLSKIQPGLRIFVEETSRLMGIRKEVRVWLSSLVEGPVTLGFLKPVILIPIATANNLSLQQVEAILLHELAHIKRNDYLLHLGITIVEILFFFNPFTRWLIRDIKKEREHRCDDWVMQFRYDPHTYVSALLTLAIQRNAQPQLALAATGSGDQLLLKRVKRILRTGEEKDRPGARALIFFLLTMAGTLLFLAPSPSSPVTSRSFPYQPAQYTIPGSRPLVGNETRFVTINMQETSDKPANRPVSAVAPSLTIRSTSLTVSAPVRKPRSASCGDPTPEEVALPENDEMALLVNADPETGSSDENFATTIQTIQKDDREYSIESGDRPDEATEAIKAAAKHLPFVPSSSFTFQSGDTTPFKVIQYAYLQSLASHDVETAVKNMQKQLQAQLEALQLNRSKQSPVLIRAQRQLLLEQLKLQEQFLRKQQELERKLERTGKVRRIVVI